MNGFEKTFLGFLIKNFYAHTPKWAKSVMLSIGGLLAAFIYFVQTNPNVVPVQYQKYVGGFCVVGLLVMQCVGVKQPQTEQEAVKDIVQVTNPGGTTTVISSVTDQIPATVNPFSKNTPPDISGRGNDS